MKPNTFIIERWKMENRTSYFELKIRETWALTSAGPVMIKRITWPEDTPQEADRLN